MVLPEFDPNAQMNVESVREQMQWFVANGFIPNPVALEDYFDPSYLDYMSREWWATSGRLYDRREHLFFQSTNSKHTPEQGHFTGHR